MSSEYPSPAKSRDQSPWRVFKGRRPWAQAAQAAGFGARPRVSRVAATLPFRDGLPFPAGVHSIYASEVQIVQEGIPEAIPVAFCYLGWQESLVQLAQLVEADIPG